jgi:hypothetical protein
VRHVRIDPCEGPGDAGAPETEHDLRPGSDVAACCDRRGPPGGAVAAVLSAPAVSVGPWVPLRLAQRLMVDRRIGARDPHAERRGGSRSPCSR